MQVLEKHGVFLTLKQKKILEEVKVSLWQLSYVCPGGFSSDSGLNAHTEKLASLTKSDLEQYFQVSENNKLEGVDGRVGLLNSLGKCILSNKKFFSTPRPGALVDYLHQNSNDGEIEAETILRTLLVSIGSIWPGRYSLGKQNLGDTWEYSPWKSKGELSSLFVFINYPSG